MNEHDRDPDPMWSWADEPDPGELFQPMMAGRWQVDRIEVGDVDGVIVNVPVGMEVEAGTRIGPRRGEKGELFVDIGGHEVLIQRGPLPEPGSLTVKLDRPL